MPPVACCGDHADRISVLTDSPLDALVDSYLDLLWHFDPVAATGSGVQVHDHELGRYTAAEITSHIAAFRSIAGALEEVAVDDLDDEIDRTALLNEIRALVYRLEHERTAVRNPGFWLSHALDGLHLLLVFRDRTEEHRARAAAGRVRRLPEFLGDARATLADCPRVFVETALQMGPPALSLIDRLAAAFGPHWTDDERQAAATAREAVAGFTQFLESEMLDGAGEGFAIGEEAFNIRLHHQHAIRSTAPELWRWGLTLLDEVEMDLRARATELGGRGDSWIDVAERLRSDHPGREALVAAYAAEMERARQFVIERDLAPVPAGPLEVVATPEFLRPLIPFAAYQPPGAFSQDQRGWFYVTPPPDDVSGERLDRMLRDHCVYDLPWTALHEGYPGHHLQFLAAYQQQRKVRKVVSTPVAVEGWALYCEEMMAEEGFATGAEQQFFQRIALLWRAARVVLDVGLHTRGMGFDDAVGFLMERVQFDRSLAEAEVRRYCAEPAYQLSYAVGRRAFLALREDYWRTSGERSLKAFHGAVLRYAGLPVTLTRWGLGLDE
jgi:uncharacterized protein (DUF885 family)